MTYEPTEADVQTAAEAEGIILAGHEYTAEHWQGQSRYGCTCGGVEFSDRHGHAEHLRIEVARAALSAVVPGIIARELRAAALSIGHYETCRPDPDRDPYIGCECRVSLLYGRADRIEAGEQP